MALKDSSARATLIRLRVLDAVTRSLEHMTVREICSNAGISRQTFYNYFESKYYVTSWWTEYCEQYYLDKIGFDYSWEEGMLRHVRLLLSKHTPLSLALSGRDESLAAPTIVRRRDRLFEALASRNVEIDDLMSFCVNTYAREKVHAMSEMLANETREEPLTILDTAQKLVAIVPSPLYEALQLPQYTKRSQKENFDLMGYIAMSVLNEAEEGLPHASWTLG